MDSSFNLRRTILRTTLPITRFLGDIHAPWSRRKLTSKHYHQVREMLRPGDAILVFKDGELSNLFIPGYWSHSGIYCGIEGSIAYVVEAIGIGVVKTDLIDIVLSRDAIMICRPKFATPGESNKASDWAKDQIGKDYDLFFSPENDAFYCSELIWLAYQNTMGILPFTLRKTLGVLTVTPQDIANATTKWDVVYDSRE